MVVMSGVVSSARNRSMASSPLPVRCRGRGQRRKLGHPEGFEQSRVVGSIVGIAGTDAEVEPYDGAKRTCAGHPCGDPAALRPGCIGPYNDFVIAS